MKYITSAVADHAAEIVCRTWDAQRQRNSNWFVGEPAYAYRISKRIMPVTYKSYVGETQWTLEAQGFESEQMFTLSFGRPFPALCATQIYPPRLKAHGLDVFCFPDESAIAGEEASDRLGNAWLLAQSKFMHLLAEIRLDQGEMLAVSSRCLFAKLRMNEEAEIERRMRIFQRMLAWLSQPEPKVG